MPIQDFLEYLQHVAQWSHNMTEPDAIVANGRDRIRDSQVVQ